MTESRVRGRLWESSVDNLGTCRLASDVDIRRGRTGASRNIMLGWKCLDRKSWCWAGIFLVHHGFGSKQTRTDKQSPRIAKFAPLFNADWFQYWIFECSCSYLRFWVYWIPLNIWDMPVWGKAVGAEGTALFKRRIGWGLRSEFENLEIR